MADPTVSDSPANLLSDAGPRDSRSRRRPEVELTQEEFAERILRERADATQLAEARLRQDYESKLGPRARPSQPL